MTKFSIHTNRAGITATFPETRFTKFFQIGINFWQWGTAFKGPVVFILYACTFEAMSFTGYTNMSYGNNQ